MQASTHCKTMVKLETAILLAFWHDVLNRFNEVRKAMQKCDVLLSIVVKLFKSLLYVMLMTFESSSLNTNQRQNPGCLTQTIVKQSDV